MTTCGDTMTAFAVNSLLDQNMTTAEMTAVGSTNLSNQCGGGKKRRSKRRSKKRTIKRRRSRRSSSSRSSKRRSSRRRSSKRRSSRRRSSRRIRRLRTHLRKKYKTKGGSWRGPTRGSPSPTVIKNKEEKRTKDERCRTEYETCLSS